MAEGLITRVVAKRRAMGRLIEVGWLDVVGRLVPWATGAAMALWVLISVAGGAVSLEEGAAVWEWQIGAWVFTP